MSGTGSVNSSTTQGTLGDAPPVSFPGVASGIDYDAIIEKYTQETLAQEAPTQAHINNLNAANTAVLRIQNLIGSVQDSLTALSNPDLFNAYKANVGNTASGSPAATATQIAGQTPSAGTYVINAQTVATSTQLANNPIANAALNTAVPLDQAGTSIGATNGSTGSGKFTVNGISVNYDVTTQSIATIVANINAAISGGGGSATLNGNGTVTLTGVTTIGSGADQGNLEQVLKLDTAQLVAGNVTSSSPIAGISASSVLNQNNNAGFATAVTSGTFTINGVQFSVNTTTNTLSDLITEINSSSAGVTASYNQETSSLTLISKTPGPQSILLGSGSDTSNFLSAAGLTNGTTTAGTQASLTYTDAAGPHTVYSSTNDFTTAIPGIDLNINTSSALPPGSTYYTVTVAADPTQAEGAINTFIKAYNAAINELNKDTLAPKVAAGQDSLTGTSSSAQTTAGGPLYGNFQVSDLRDQLVQAVSGFIPVNSSSYNSLQSVGIELDTNSQSVGTSDSNDSSDSSNSSQSDSSTGDNNNFAVTSTSGQLSPLDTTSFEAAYAANTIAVSNLFTQLPKLTTIGSGTQGANTPVTGSPSGFAYNFGNLLSNSNGLPTFLTNTVVTPSNLAFTTLPGITDSNNQQIDSLQQQINLINREANQQADELRAQFSASESQIAQLQALQTQIAAIGH